MIAGTIADMIAGIIDPRWEVSDLDPHTWRRLGPFFEPRRYIAAALPGEHGLFVLHDAGQLLKVVDTEGRGRPEGIPDLISDPEALAHELYARGQWQRVHVIDRRHLAHVARTAQAAPRRDLTLDAYYHMVYTLIWGDPQGYACEPPRPRRWHGWTYAETRRFVEALPSPSSLALGIYADNTNILTAGLILVAEGGRIRRVTTFEALDWQAPPPGPTDATLAALRAALEAQFAPPAAILLCTEDAFSGWLDAPDKRASLEAARAHADAVWYLTDNA